MEKDQPFVKHEYGVGLAQSEQGLTQSSKMNVRRQIDNCMREIIEGLRSAETLARSTNEILLPSMEKPLAKEGKVEQAPNGWFEQHLADLRLANHKTIKIISRLNRLNLEIRTEDKVGQ